jgi:PAS domain S-box-containing protein
VTAPYAPDINRLRRRLRGLTDTTFRRVLQEQLETFSAAALAADNTGRYIAANRVAAALTGYSREELLRLTVRDLMPALRNDPHGERWHRFIHAGTQAGDYVLQRQDGSPVGVHYVGYASVAPGVHVLVLTPLELPSSI